MNTFENAKQTADKTEENEQEDRRLADAMPQIVWFARPDGYLNYYNRRWFEYTGMTLEETAGWSWQPVLHPDDVERCVAVWSKAVETGEPYEIEYRFKRAADGQYRWHLGRALPMRDRQGKIVKWCGTCTDIDDQKRAENELSLLRDELEARIADRINELSEVNQSLLEAAKERKTAEAALEREREFLSAVFESVTDGIAACDASGVLTLFNRATREFHGLPETPVPADKWAEHFDLYLPDGETLMKKEQIPLFRALQDDKVRDAEIVIAPKNAPTRRLVANGQAIFNKRGQKIGAVVGMRDVTEQRVIEEKLRKSEEQYRQIVDNAGDIIYRTDTKGRFTFVNDAAVNFMKRSAEELIGTVYTDLIRPDYRRRTAEFYNRQAVNREPKTYFEYPAIAADGKEIWLGQNVQLLFEDERTVGFQAVAIDVTAQKNLEAALKLNEARMSEAQAIAHLGSWDFDIVNNKVNWSDELYRIFGLTPQEYDGTYEGYLEYVHPDDLERVKNTLEQSISEKKYSDLNHRILRPDGTIRAVHANGIVIEDENGAAIKMSGTLHDITERVEVENALRESEARTRELIINAKDTIYTMDLSGNFTSLNPAGERLTGYTEAEALQMNIADVIGADAAKLMRRRMASNIKGAGLPDFELELIVKGGDRVIVGVSTSLIVKNGKPVGIQGIGRDITERKKAEILLKNSEEFNRSIFENSPDCVKVLELDGKLNSMNANGLCIMEIDDFQPFVGEVWIDFWQGEENKAAREAIEIARSGKPANFEGFCKTAKGTMKYWDVSVAPIFDATGQPCRLISTSRDITERKRAEEAKALLAAQLEIERTRLVAAQSVAKVGSWETDLVTLAVNWSAETFHIFELDPHQFQPDHRGFLQFVHPDDQAAVNDAFAKSFDQDSICSFEHRISLADGRIKFIEERWEILRNERGKPLQAVGTCQDITERKLFENALLQSERKLFQIMDAMPVGVFVIDSAGKPYFANQAAQHILGEGIMPDVTTDKLGAVYSAYSAGTSQLYPEERMPIVRALNGEKVIVSDMEIHRRETVIPLEVWAAPIYETDGTVSYAIAAFKDITEQKRIESESRVVFEITQGIATTANLDDLLELVHQSISQAIYAENFYIALYDKSSELFFIPFCRDEFDAVAPPQKLGKGLTAYVFRRGIATLLTKKDIERLVEQGSVALVGTPPAIWLGVPLRTPSEIIGVIVVQHYTDDQAYNRRDLEFLTSIADQIAQAIERKRTQEKLLQLSSIVESSDDAIISQDLDGIILSWNRGAEHLYGYVADEVIGKNILLIFPPGSEDEEAQILRKIKQGESIEYYETVRMRKDGSLPNLSLTISPLRNVAGEIIGAAKIAHDITERKQMMVELERARDAALESTRLKSEFLANMSHEIRTPMNGIIGMTGLALDTVLDTNQREYLEMVRQSSESLLIVINDILDFSKIEARKIELESVAFDFNKAIGDCLKPLALRAAQKNLKLTNRIAPDVPVVLEGDPNRLAQILNNLVGNAVKFTETGEISVIVDKELETLDAIVLHFQVRDTGIGIPAGKQSAIFEAFAQADGTTTRKYGGTGLGLAITTQLVGLMKGSVWVESPAQTDSDQENPGSVFHFTVRLKPSSLERLKGAAPDSDKQIEGLAGRKTGLRVLLAEDNYINQRLAIKLLEKYRHTVKLAVNGAEAVAAARDESFDVILMDVQMPLMNGFDATRAIIELEKSTGRAHTPIVAMTANAMKGDRERCLEAGMDDYIAKPIRADELFQIIERLAGNFIKETTNETIDSTAEGSLDLSTLLWATGGDRSLAFELIRIFLADAPTKMHQIRKSIDETDGPALARAAHAFMSSVGYFPQSQAIEFLRKLEDMGKNDRFDAAAETYDNLSGSVEQISRFLEECINQKELGL